MEEMIKCICPFCRGTGMVDSLNEVVKEVENTPASLFKYFKGNCEFCHGKGEYYVRWGNPPEENKPHVGQIIILKKDKLPYVIVCSWGNEGGKAIHYELTPYEEYDDTFLYVMGSAVNVRDAIILSCRNGDSSQYAIAESVVPYSKTGIAEFEEHIVLRFERDFSKFPGRSVLENVEELFEEDVQTEGI